MRSRPIRPRAVARQRRLNLNVDSLESRQLLTTTTAFTARPMFELGPLVRSPTPPPGAYTPAQIQQAYGFNQVAFGTVKGDGTGQTIAIVDAYDDPNIQADLNVFNRRFGLPDVTVTRVNQYGGTSYPAVDSTGGWESEEALDVEWAHAVAPGANILLVEASSANDADLLTAVNYAAAHANVVSMSWGGSEFSGETSYDSSFNRSGVVFVASSGDSGAPISWPAASPNVLAVGGTALKVSTGSSWSSETGWSGSGGGPSAYASRPSYQAGVVTQTTRRANPDVAYDASPSTGFAVYDSYPQNGISYGWMQIGGTSAGAPQWAGIVAIADQGLALSGQPALNSAGPQQVQTILYQNAGTAEFHDVLTGTSAGSPHYTAGTGYDYVTGIGSPVANLVVKSLTGGSVNTSSDHLVISASMTDVAGSALSVTVTAVNASGTIDLGYTGTIHFSSSDTQAGLPANYTFSAADGGTRTFLVTLKTAGAQSVTATDTASAVITGKLGGITVSPAAASQIILTGLPSSTTAGAVQTVTVAVEDSYGNIATGYSGTVQFSTSDAQAGLPGSYSFTTADQGVHSFTLTFQTAGTQTLTVSDRASGLTVTQSGITVSPAAPLNLTARTISGTEIDLTWIGSAGATGYQVQRSANGSTGWTQIGVASVGATSYQDTGLSPGTTYYYRVVATGAALSSLSSGIASATTVAATSGAVTNTIWSSSYVPAEDSYSSGSYELGVKFVASTSGSVTGGARFYKQSWMGGYTHVGHLWTSNGVLLASATFANESASGWQQVNFSRPVSIAANSVHIISFSTGGGYFGISTNYFNSGGISNGPLQALGNGAYGGDGVYRSGNGLFPNVSGSGMNFWADVVFAPASTPTSARAAALGGATVTTNAIPVAPATAPTVTPPVSTELRTKAARPAATTVSDWPYRRVVSQALLLSSTIHNKGITTLDDHGV